MAVSVKGLKKNLTNKVSSFMNAPEKAARIKVFLMSSKGSFLIIIAMAIAVFVGVFFNALFPSKDRGETDVYKNFGDRTIEKDGVRTTISEYLQGTGVVCLGDVIASEPEALFVGLAEGQWNAIGFEVPSAGTLCMVINDLGEAVNYFFGWDEDGIKRELDYLNGRRDFDLEYVRAVYNSMDGQPSTIDSKYLFSVCSDEDCILPIESPEYFSGSGDSSGLALADDDEVVVVQLLDVVRVYPIKTLSVYPLILDKVWGVQYLVTYDWLTNKVTVFKAVINGDQPSFGFVGKVYNSNILIYDSLTGTWWQQFGGEGVLGEAAGFKLETLPYKRVSWSIAKEIEEAQIVDLNPGEAVEGSMLAKVEEYQSSDRLYYVISEQIKDPKELVYWNETEISYKFGYELFY